MFRTSTENRHLQRTWLAHHHLPPFFWPLLLFDNFLLFNFILCSACFITLFADILNKLASDHVIFARPRQAGGAFTDDPEDEVGEEELPMEEELMASDEEDQGKTYK